MEPKTTAARTAAARPTTARAAAVLLALGLAAGAAAPAQAAPPTAAAVAAPAAVVGSANDRLVTAWYRDVLGRDPAGAQQDARGRAAWVDRLDRGERREDVLRAITRTPESAQRTVDLVYANYLQRSPDRGAQVWVTGLQAGTAPEWVEQNVLASAEYAAGRRDSADYTTRLYYVVLERAPRAGERAYWEERLRRADRLSVVRELWYTPEAVVVRTDVAYRELLGRSTAGDPGAASWYPSVVASRLETEIALASSAEYAAGAR